MSRTPDRPYRTGARGDPQHVPPATRQAILDEYRKGHGVCAIAVRLAREGHSVSRKIVERVLAGRPHYSGYTIGESLPESLLRQGDCLTHLGDPGQNTRRARR